MTSRSEMSAIRANFMLAFEAAHGRLPEVSRKQLVNFDHSLAMSAAGPMAKTLRWPAWLTGEERYRIKDDSGNVRRGVFRMPWAELDAYMASREQDRSKKAELANLRASEMQQRASERTAKRVARDQEKAKAKAAREEARTKREAARAIAKAAKNVAEIATN